MPEIDSHIRMGHGSGGEMMQTLLGELFLPLFGQPFTGGLADSAILPVTNLLPAFTTDSYVIDPIIFPGGNIGTLAVCGTVNDLAVTGAKPKYISAGFIIEEGLQMSVLRGIVTSMAEEARKAGVRIITGDTKVVEKGKADKLFINTTGIGYMEEKHFHIHRAGNAVPGDIIIINGCIGDHSIAVLSARDEFGFSSPVTSDCSSLAGMIGSVLRQTDGIRWMRDITRGGLATVICDLVDAKDFGAKLMEEYIPVREPVEAACEMLGFDPLYLANEGKVLMIVDREEAEKVLHILMQDPLGHDAAIIGELTASNPGEAVLYTGIGGGSRLLHPLPGVQLPRIC
jgi:hydrogenase expression/formation protein HypE